MRAFTAMLHVMRWSGALLLRVVADMWLIMLQATWCRRSTASTSRCALHPMRQCIAAASNVQASASA
jgi:hypothetical protein